MIHAPPGRRTSLSCLAAMSLALTGTGCAALQSGAATYLSWQKGAPHGDAVEQIFSVRWWVKADEGFMTPYRPVETSQPEVDPKSGSVFTVTSDGKVHAFDHKGRPLWDLDLATPFDAGPTFAENRLYVAGSKGQVVAVDATSGKQLWEYDATEEIVTKPVLALGMVFVVSSADTIYALDQLKGEWRWQYRREAPATDFTVRGAARPAVADGRLFAGFADGFAVSLDARDGTLQWAKDLGGAKPFADVDAGPVLDDEGHVFFASFASGIFALEAATGKLVWTAPRNGVNALALDPATRRLFAGGDGFAASYQARTGAGIWSVSLGADHAVSGIGLANGLMIASTGLGPLLFIDGFNGRLRRSFDPGRGVSAPVNVVGAQAYVLSNRGVLYDLGIEARATP